VCTPVKQYVQKQRLVMQKQAELAREREARAYGGGGGGMMQARAPAYSGTCAQNLRCPCRACPILLHARCTILANPHHPLMH
jgi:hypothetical protein